MSGTPLAVICLNSDDWDDQNLLFVLVNIQQPGLGMSSWQSGRVTMSKTNCASIFPLSAFVTCANILLVWTKPHGQVKSQSRRALKNYMDRT